MNANSSAAGPSKRNLAVRSTDGNQTMRTIKILIGFYFTQMFLGLAIGFTLPWLRYWGLI
jgi:hypothetical protein